MTTVSAELATRVARDAISAPYRQINTMRTDDVLKWLKDRGLRLMHWESVHLMWAAGVLRPIALESRAVEQTPFEFPKDRFQEADLGDGTSLLIDLGVKVETVPSSDIWKDGLDSSLDDSLIWHPFQLPNFQSIHAALRNNMALDMSLRGSEACGQFCAKLTAEVSGRLRDVANDARNEESESLLALLLSIDPVIHPSVYGRITWSGYLESQEGFWEWREEFDAKGQLQALGFTVERLVEVHRDMSVSAGLHDPLRHFRNLIQHMSRDRRRHLNGDALASHDLYDFAETLRRYLEAFHNVGQLPEEDDYLGMGPEASQRVKNTLFGSKRTADPDRSALWRIVRYFGVDPQIRATWFLEGDTEVAFFERLAEHYGIDLDRHGLVLYNLEGNARHGRSREVRHMLKQLEQGGAFAFIALDRDEQGGTKHLVALQKLDEQGLLTAGHRIWDPDFEAANFTGEELAKAATLMAQEQGAVVEFTETDIVREMEERGKTAGKAVEALLNSEQLFSGKGRLWGQCLANVAIETESDRPAIEDFQKLYRASWADFDFSVKTLTD